MKQKYCFDGSLAVRVLAETLVPPVGKETILSRLKNRVYGLCHQIRFFYIPVNREGVFK